jgi:hypothetical protein
MLDAGMIYNTVHQARNVAHIADRLQFIVSLQFLD